MSLIILISFLTFVLTFILLKILYKNHFEWFKLILQQIIICMIEMFQQVSGIIFLVIYLISLTSLNIFNCTII